MANLFSKMFNLEKDPLGFQQEKRDLMRGIAGSMIFGIPILYTMEVWFDGQMFSPAMSILMFLSFLALNIFFSYFAGLRENHRSERLISALDDGVTSLGLSVLIALVILSLIGQLDPAGDLRAELGKILLEAGIISIGVTFTNFKFKNTSTSKTSLNQLVPSTLLMSAEQKQIRKDLNDFLAAALGALVFSFNVAPTEEVTLIATHLSPLQLLGLLLAEIIICFIVLYASGLKDHVIYKEGSFFQRPFNEVILTTSVSLVIAALLIASVGFGDISLSDPHFVSTVIVLGLPATVGGAAGRLVV